MTHLPRSIKVGRKRYKVALRATPAKHIGSVDYQTGVIEVATRGFNNRRLTRKDIAESFWHEVVHAVLWDMKSPLHANERFVTRFSHTLNNAIQSAKLT